MAGKMSFMAGLGAGYVLGARSGRERYEQIAGRAQALWHDPRVQEKAEQAQQLVKDKVGSSGPAPDPGAGAGSGVDTGATGPGAPASTGPRTAAGSDLGSTS